MSMKNLLGNFYLGRLNLQLLQLFPLRPSELVAGVEFPGPVRIFLAQIIAVSND